MIGLALAALLAFAPSATHECSGLQNCVPVRGPWVIVPTAAAAVPRPEVQYELSCPKGYVVGGIDAELSDRAIDLWFLGLSGSPVAPGRTTSRSIVFAARYVGTADLATTFRPHVGCVPTSGGGSRTPTAVHAVVPPGSPTVRHTKNVAVPTSRRVVASCATGERLVATNVARALDVPAPPSRQTISLVHTKVTVRANSVVVAAQGTPHAFVQVTAICAGGR